MLPLKPNLDAVEQWVLLPIDDFYSNPPLSDVDLQGVVTGLGDVESLGDL